ncbi:MAG TPA: hypothetical protein VHR88_06735 [Solirubrobacteraceae bacterium]|nr:hypothetical protein [Solirubrobacteraceae bacterium]
MPDPPDEEEDEDDEEDPLEDDPLEDDPLEEDPLGVGGDGEAGALGCAGDPLGTGADGVGTDGVGTEGVGADGVEGVGVQVVVLGTVVTGVVTSGVSTHVSARTGNTAAVKAAHARAMPMSRMRLSMTLPMSSRTPALPRRLEITLPESFRMRASTVQRGFRARKGQLYGCKSARRPAPGGHPPATGESSGPELILEWRVSVWFAGAARYSPRRRPRPRGTEMAEDDEGLRRRLARQGEEAVGKLAQELLENPLFSSTLSRAFEAREKAVQAQTVAMGALNLPSAADIERLTRRLRSVSQRLEGIEDGVERLDDRLAEVDAASDTSERLRRIEEQLESLSTELAALSKRLPDESAAVSIDQERLEVPSEN